MQERFKTKLGFLNRRLSKRDKRLSKLPRLQVPFESFISQNFRPKKEIKFVKPKKKKIPLLGIFQMVKPRKRKPRTQRDPIKKLVITSKRKGRKFSFKGSETQRETFI